MTAPIQSDKDIPVASARTLGSAVRKTLKELGLDWKVKCSTVSFSGFGYGSMPFAEIETTRLLTYIECSTLADTLRRLRADPKGGKGIIKMNGRDYAFGGSIGHNDYPSGAAFWRQVGFDLNATERKVTPVIKEAERRVLLAYEAEKPGLNRDVWCKGWIDSGIASPEAWANGWPDIYAEDEKPNGWPGIKAFEGKVVRP
jgi:hypothetical protein